MVGRHGASRGVVLTSLALVIAAAFVPRASSAQGAAPAQQQTVATDFGIRIGGARSDNILRVPVNEESGSYTLLGLTFDLARVGRRLDASLIGDVEVRDYDIPNLDNEPVGSLNASLSFDIVPERFEWFVDDSYGQTRANPFQAVGPGNRQEVNVIATGPRLNLPIGGRTFARLTGTHRQREFDQSNRLDSTVADIEAGAYRSLSTTTEVGLAVSSQETTYDDFTVPDSEIESVFVSYQRRLATGNASLRVGRTKAGFAGTDRSGPLIGLNWVRGIGARSQLTIDLQNSLSDTGAQFLRNNVVNNVLGTPATLLQTPDVFEFSSLGLAFAITGERSTFSIGATLGQAEYLNDTTLDSDQGSVNVSYQRELSTAWVFGIGTNVFEREFEQFDRVDRDRGSQLWLARAGRRVSARISFQAASRDGRNSIRPYDENLVQISFDIDLNP